VYQAASDAPPLDRAGRPAAQVPDYEDIRARSLCFVHDRVHDVAPVHHQGGTGVIRLPAFPLHAAESGISARVVDRLEQPLAATGDERLHANLVGIGRLNTHYMCLAASRPSKIKSCPQYGEAAVTPVQCNEDVIQPLLAAEDEQARHRTPAGHRIRRIPDHEPLDIRAMLAPRDDEIHLVLFREADDFDPRQPEPHRKVGQRSPNRTGRVTDQGPQHLELGPGLLRSTSAFGHHQNGDPGVGSAGEIEGRPNGGPSLGRLIRGDEQMANLHEGRRVDVAA